METEKRLHRCSFTGHRPEKLSFSESEVKPLLEKAIDNAIAVGYANRIGVKVVNGLKQTM